MDISPLRRRHALGLAGAAAVSSVMPVLAQEPPKPAQIVVNQSGGAMASAMRKAFFTTFEKKYGIKVVETSPADFGKLRAMVESGNVEWDVTEIGKMLAEMTIPRQQAIYASELGYPGLNGTKALELWNAWLLKKA